MRRENERLSRFTNLFDVAGGNDWDTGSNWIETVDVYQSTVKWRPEP